MKPVAHQLVESKRSLTLLAIIGFLVLPLMYSMDVLTIGQINMIGRYMTFAILALGLDLLWAMLEFSAFVSVLSSVLGPMLWVCTCPSRGTGGIIDANRWKLPACLFVVYPYDVGESSGDALVPFF